MNHVLPSDIVRALEEEFPLTLRLKVDASGVTNEAYRAGTIVPGILALINEIPEDLMTIDSSERTRLVLSMIALDQAAEWQRRTTNGIPWPRLKDNTPCLSVVRDALLKCHDQAPSQSAQTLLFIGDNQFRLTLAVDLGSAEKALNNGEWKAATVLGGSIIEALLLWALQQHTKPERAAAMQRAVRSGKISRVLQVDDLTAWEWSLHPYIEVAYELGEIKEHTANPCREAKYYRNLIHPAAAERDKEKCTRGKAHGALGAVYSTIEDLEEKHPSAA